MDTNLSNQNSLQQEQYDYESEMNFRDMLLLIFQRKKFILTVTAIFTILAIVYALLVTPIYKAKVILLPPSDGDVASLNVPGFSDIDKETLYFLLETSLNSVSIQREVFDEMKLEKVLIDSSKLKGVSKDALLDKYFSTYKITKPRPGKGVNKVKSIRLELNGKDPKQIADVLNNIVNFANNHVITDIKNNIKSKVSKDIQSLEKKIRDLKRMSVITIADDIAKLEENDKLSRNNIKVQIAVLKQAAKVQKSDKILSLEEAAKIANGIGIIDHFSLNKSELKIELLSQPEPLYYRGVKALQAEIQALKSRDSNDPFIKGLRDLEKNLKLLSHNQNIKVLQDRKNNDPFIGQLRQAEKSLADMKLIKSNILSDTHKPNAALFDQMAYPNNNKIKPHRARIVIIGLFLGLFVGVFLAFMSYYMRKDVSKLS